MLLHVFIRLAVFNLTGHLHGFAVITEEEESHTDAHGGNRSEEVRWWWWGGGRREEVCNARGIHPDLAGRRKKQ